MLTLILSLISLQASQPPDEDEIEALEAEAAETLEDAAERQARADALATEIATLQARLVAAADRVRESENAAEEAETELQRLEREEAEILTRLRDERENLARVLAALQRMEASSPPALAINPDDAAEAARAAGLMARLAPELNNRARSLSLELRNLESLRTELRSQRINVADAEADLTDIRDEVEGLIAERRNAERELRSESEALSQRAAQIASRADNLRDLMTDINDFAALEPRLSPMRVDRIENNARPSADPDYIPVPRLRPDLNVETQPDEPTTAVLTSADEGLLEAIPVTGDVGNMEFADMQGRLRAPVLGRISTGFRETGHDGQRRDGIWMEGRSRAQVTAPFDGIVVYAGDFQSLESVLLINTEDGYTIVIGGMALIYANEGQSVLAGEPVGALHERENPPPRLYFGILRSTDQAEDPEAWFRPEFRRDQ